MAAPPPALLHALGQAQRTPTALAFAAAALRPAAAQRRRLEAAVALGRDSAYGRAHGLRGATDPKSYARNVPVLTPEALKPWVARQMRGEAAVLTTERPVYYVRTTGSTGTPKHIPITPAYQAEFQKTVHVALWHLYRRFPAAFIGRALYFVGSSQVDVAPDGAPIGTMSGYNFAALSPLVRAIYAWPQALFEVEDLATRSYLALHLACLGEVSLVAGIFPAPIVYLLRDLEARAGELARHLGLGELPAWLRLTSAERATFEHGLVPRPDLAERLREAERAPVEEKVGWALPQLRLVYCWTNATAGAYLPELQRRLGPAVAIRDAIYSACEAWCSIPVGDEAPGGPFAITSHYFELVEEARAEAVGDPSALVADDFRTVDEVEDGRRYYIVPTTSGGLYRYWLGDVVEIVGRHARTPRLRFVRKGGAATNLVGEKLDEAHVNAAVAAGLEALGLEATFFMVTPRPEPGERPAYVLWIELPPDAPDAVLGPLAERVDVALQEGSFDLGRVRRAAQLGPLEARRLPPGSYAAHRQAKVAAGSAESQLKVAHLGDALPP
ncbi:MAG TPA: GH3 auxin-responsive promoter family protein, partial [Polyangiaceae bacterium LLY-WYZ-15_(1-7)]|nr:GH3 auxin-responsive promoter family protein [Polyangiaceae bacterium LLY-WYZ-15_(1-7)]